MMARDWGAGGMWVIGLCLAAAAWAETPPHAQPPADAAAAREELIRGRALFFGALDLQGRMYTHTVDMPPSVVRCANCHAVAQGAEVPRSLAPRLTRGLLVLPHARRGGPPSSYSRGGFCTLLRRGIDPAFVMISVEMPRYTIDDVNCAALWRYLTASDHEGIEP